jgi:hypothetical protein
MEEVVFMSNLIVVDRDKITAIADAIREKTESDLSYTIDEMPDTIRAIEGGSGDGGDVYIGNLIIGNAKNALPIDIIEN